MTPETQAAFRWLRRLDLGLLQLRGPHRHSTWIAVEYAPGRFNDDLYYRIKP